MRQGLLTVLGLAALIAAPALAKDQDRPVTGNAVTAEDVATTPMTDFGLKKGEIPPLLIAAREKPYDLEGLDSCQKIASAIGELDVLLGDDLDLPQGPNGRVNPGLVAQWVVGSFIPFRGLVREISGANAHRRDLEAAVMAGVARRAFLKGNGEMRRCEYPARSVPPAIFAQKLEEVAKQPAAAPPPGSPAARRAARRAERERRNQED
jgi:hypothetical protein